MITFTESDINLDLARRAFYNTSFNPERRGDSYVTGYMADMQAVVEEFSGYATDDNRAEIAADLERYRQGYITRLHAYLQSHSRVASTLITGPANFPVERNRKRSEAADKRAAEWLEYSKVVLEKLRRKYDPRRLADAPISSDDNDAVSKLQEKIEAAERGQQMMKDANAIIRRKIADDKKVTELVKLGMGEAMAWESLKPDFAGRVGYPDYALKNNNANIRRMKERIAQIERERSRPATVDAQPMNGVTVTENQELNRLQVFFDGKPAVEVREVLKRYGFKWAPSQGAWQRQLNANARYALKQVIEKING